MSIKPIILSFFFFLFTLNLSLAQTEIRGKVRDAETGKPLEFANVALLNPTIQQSNNPLNRIHKSFFDFIKDNYSQNQ